MFSRAEAGEAVRISAATVFEIVPLHTPDGCVWRTRPDATLLTADSMILTYAAQTKNVRVRDLS